LIGDVEDHDVIIFDEEISTGSTIESAVKICKKNGAREMVVLFIHAVLSPNAPERLAGLPVREFVTTDTVPIPPEKRAKFGERLKIITVAPLLGEVIRRANQGRSVGELFNE